MATAEELSRINVDLDEAANSLERATTRLLQNSTYSTWGEAADTMRLAAKVLSQRQTKQQADTRDRLLAWLVSRAVPSAAAEGSEFSCIALAAPDKELVRELVSVMDSTMNIMNDHETLASEFAACIWFEAEGVDEDFIKWLSELFGFGAERVPVIEQECPAFDNACATGKYGLAKWMFFEFNLAQHCSAESMREVIKMLDTRCCEKIQNGLREDARCALEISILINQSLAP